MVNGEWSIGYYPTYLQFISNGKFHIEVTY